ADLAVQGDHVSTRRSQSGERVPVGAAGRDLFALVPGRQLERAGDLEQVRLAAPVRLRHIDQDVANAAELRDRLVRVVERLPVPARLVLDLLDALALDRLRNDD